MEYQIIVEPDILDLIEQVNLATQEGWVPQGGITFFRSTLPIENVRGVKVYTGYAQPIVRYTSTSQLSGTVSKGQRQAIAIRAAEGARLALLRNG